MSDVQKAAVEQGALPEGGMSRRAVMAGTAVAAAAALSACATGQDRAGDAAGDRGSDRLLEHAGSEGQTFSPEELRQVIGVFRKHKGKFIDWCQYGQPKVDSVCGTVVVQPAAAGQALADLLSGRNITSWRVGVFPKGTPVFDQVMFRLQAGMRGVVIIDG